MARSPNSEICARIAQLRKEVCGPRGKSAFAKRLGLSPSTYDYYENDRVPPADVLVAIADEAGVDLRWLITGQAGPESARRTDHPILQRAASLLARHPDAAAALGAFLDVLAESKKFPPKQGAEPAPASGDDRRGWLPVLGRSAAGVPQFWNQAGGGDGVTLLGEIIDRHAQKAARETRPALARQPGQSEQSVVQIIVLGQVEPGDPAEFVAAAGIKSRWPDSFAVRIDGESMAPDIRHGDLVILSPSAPAEEGKAAVVQLADQIGVTCKLFHRRGGQVHLVPINEQFAPQSFAATAVVWALRVLARVRPQ